MNQINKFCLSKFCEIQSSQLGNLDPLLYFSLKHHSHHQKCLLNCCSASSRTGTGTLIPLYAICLMVEGRLECAIDFLNLLVISAFHPEVPRVWIPVRHDIFIRYKSFTSSCEAIPNNGPGGLKKKIWGDKDLS